MTVGKRIKSRRLEIGINAEELAERVGKHPATIYRYENGEIEGLPANLLQSLADVLKTTPEYLMGWPEGQSHGKKEASHHMNELKIFNSPEFGDVRAVEIDGEPWLVGKDVAQALGYKDTDQALRKHVDEEDKLTRQFDGSGQNRHMTIINESGLYSLILSSRLPGARKFHRWVTSEVLPSVRKHGAYLTEETLEQAILNPDTMIRLCTALKEERDKRKALEAANAALTVDLEIAQPKASYFDQLVDRNLLTSFRDTAKQFGVKERAFIAFLLDKKFIYRDKKGHLMPYAEKNDGLFEVKESFNDKTNWSGTQTLITPKGRETFRLLCQGI